MSSSFYSQIGIPSTSSTAIESSVNQAATSESNAATSATNSATSASAAAASAVSANAADVSATQSKNAAEAAETAAQNHASVAAALNTAAQGHANTASTKAAEATANANNASTSATNAAASAASAASDLAAIGTSVTDAAASATSAAASLSTFQNQYLGASATAPTQDPDGSALDLGDLYFDTAANVMKVYSDSGWVNASSSVNGTSERQTYTATAGQTTFNVTYDAGYVDVWLNGVKLLAGTDFTATSGTNIVLASPAAANDIVDIIAFGTFVFTQSDHYTKTQSDARYVASSSLNGDIDTHLNQSSATSGQYLKWNGSDYAWDTVAAGYSDSDVDTHLNQSTATTDQFLKWNGSDYAWAAVPAGYTDSDVDAHLLTAGVTLDATNDRLGVGTSSPSHLLTVGDGLTGTKTIALSGSGSSSSVMDLDFLGGGSGNPSGRIRYSSSSEEMTFHTGDIASIAERMTIRSDGNTHIAGSLAVGVEDYPFESGNRGYVHIEGSAGALLALEDTGNQSYLFANDAHLEIINTSNGNMTFGTNGTERARLTSDGNFLVSTTNVNPHSDGSGIALRENAGVLVGVESTHAIIAARHNTDGEIIRIQSGTTTVGSIKNIGSQIAIGDSPSASADMVFGTTSLFYPSVDNVADAGASSRRLDDIFATNGTIQTSDEREKQQIASLTDAEITAAKAISKLFKTFKWNDKVEAKGDAARTHTGVVAQQVEQAMTDAGLDVSKYAFWCSDTWWEKDVEVAAVEADEEKGIEAQEAYTRNDIYDTQEEAPEGATERNRKGIRYPELLSFIGAATEQRLTNIETRLEALEAE